MLGEGTVYVTVLRNPADQFESTYKYYRFESVYQTDVKGFVQNYVKQNKQLRPARVRRIFGPNQQLYDLGLEKDQLKNVTAVKDKIREVEDNFDLVMITEDFDASLVLLSELLCLPLRNVTSLKKNERTESAKVKLDTDTREALSRWLWADQMLYDHFKGTAVSGNHRVLI